MSPAVGKVLSRAAVIERLKWKGIHFQARPGTVGSLKDIGLRVSALLQPWAGGHPGGRGG